MAEIQIMLHAMSTQYCRKVAGDTALIVQIDVGGPQGPSWCVDLQPGQQPEVYPGSHPQARFIFRVSAEWLARIYEGDLAPLTAVGRERLSDPAPLDFALGDGLTLTPEVYAELVTFVQRFFNCSVPERILLGESHTRSVHGGRVVGLYYHPGFRSAWYTLKKGERLNEPDDTNPFPQAFVFLSGAGRATINGQTVAVKANESYYIPPGAEHVVWAESDEPLTLLFLAWGPGA